MTVYRYPALITYVAVQRPMLPNISMLITINMLTYEWHYRHKISSYSFITSFVFAEFSRLITRNCCLKSSGLYVCRSSFLSFAIFDMNSAGPPTYNKLTTTLPPATTSPFLRTTFSTRYLSTLHVCVTLCVFKCLRHP